MIIAIRNSRPGEGARVVEIWRRAVDVTRGFLTREDRKAIDELVCGFLLQAPLWLAVDAKDYPMEEYWNPMVAQLSVSNFTEILL
ncbi:MAG: hypothetical protein JJT87_00795 [Halomonas sp.]|nr:hypothetical protein [Halomonas sp.]MCC5900453.1 hypothetical protein [Halomonas sp.]